MKYGPLVFGLAAGAVIGYVAAIGGVGVAIRDAHDRRADAEAALKRVVELAGNDLDQMRQRAEAAEAKAAAYEPKDVAE